MWRQRIVLDGASIVRTWTCAAGTTSPAFSPVDELVKDFRAKITAELGGGGGGLQEADRALRPPRKLRQGAALLQLAVAGHAT